MANAARDAGVGLKEVFRALENVSGGSEDAGLQPPASPVSVASPAREVTGTTVWGSSKFVAGPSL